jgi:hypothetical protein
VFFVCSHWFIGLLGTGTITRREFAYEKHTTNSLLVIVPVPSKPLTACEKHTTNSLLGFVPVPSKPMTAYEKHTTISLLVIVPVFFHVLLQKIS